MAQESETGAKKDRSFNHERIYLILLSILALLGALQIGMFALRIPRAGEATRGFELVTFILTCFLAAMVGVILLRLFAPAKAGALTTAVNVLLLIAFPFGTALGIYGLWKVDRRPMEPTYASHKHDRIYLILLMLLTWGCVIAVGEMIMFRSWDSGGSTSGYTLVIGIMSCYLAAMFATIALRVFATARAVMLTKVLNILLLLYVPIGTALGIYGLWKVDKVRPGLS
jgi:hypothetical protein